MRAKASPEADAPAVDIRGLSKWFGAFKALDGLELSVARGERLVICGPSGSGKSTLIRTINALEGFDEGEIRVEGIRLTREPAAAGAIRLTVGMGYDSSTLLPQPKLLESSALPP